MPNQQTALTHLSRNPILYMDMIEPIRRGTAEILFAGPEGVFVREKISGALMLTAQSEAGALKMLTLADHADLFVAHEAFAIAPAAERYGLAMTMPCYQTAWLHPEEPPPAPDVPFTFAPLAMQHLARAQALYSHDAGAEYLQNRIQTGNLFGAFDGEILTGIAGLHAEGSMGMLEVDPAYRRRHIGAFLTASLCCRLMAEGHIPFAQFVQGNDASRRLQAAMGFTISEDLIYWLERP